MVCLSDVLVVPQMGLAHEWPVAGAAQPCWRRRIEGFLLVIAEQSDRISLNVTAFAILARLIINAEPKKAHGSDGLADRTFQSKFAGPDCGGSSRVAIIPRRTGVPVSFDEGSSDDQAKD